MNNSSEKKKAAGPMVWVLLTGFLLFVVGVIAGAWIYIPEWYGEESIQAGTFGDMFGGVNALFSGLAFALLVVTLYLQMQELSLQREELAETREELKGQHTQMRLQNEALRKQAFEATFFRMISLHNEIVAGMKDMTSGSNGSPSLTGRQCFGPLRHYLETLPVFSSSGTHTLDLREREAMEQKYQEFKEHHLVDIAHYFQSITQILNFVDQANMKSSERCFYVDIVRGQLSTLELWQLFYFCVVGPGNPRCKELVEKYALLEHLQKDLLIFQEHLLWINESAFDSSVASKWAKARTEKQ